MPSENGNKIFITLKQHFWKSRHVRNRRLKCFADFPEMLFQGNKNFITLFTRHVFSSCFTKFQIVPRSYKQTQMQIYTYNTSIKGRFGMQDLYGSKCSCMLLHDIPISSLFITINENLFKKRSMKSKIYRYQCKQQINENDIYLKIAK